MVVNVLPPGSSLTLLEISPSYRHNEILNNITTKSRYSMTKTEYAAYTAARCKVKCECGNIIECSLNIVKSGRKKSCGSVDCNYINPVYRIGKPQSVQERRIHSKWGSMHQRCYNKKNHNYYNYGAKNITVCDEWNRTNPYGRKNYTKWYIEELSKPYVNGIINPTVDRKDSSKGYNPDNCRLASKSTQSANQNIVDRNGLSGKYKYVRPIYNRHGVNILFGYWISIKYMYISYTMMATVQSIPVNTEFEALLCVHFIKWKNHLIDTTVQPIPCDIRICDLSETKQHARYTIKVENTINKNAGQYKQTYKYGLVPYAKNIGLRVVKWLEHGNWVYSTIAMSIDILKMFSISPSATVK